MDRKREVRDFLVSRRSALAPEQVGLPTTSRRRVPGLRRGEVAELAGLSVEYYARLERGELGGASDQVIDAIAGALRLDGDERRHLVDLAVAVRRPPGPGTRPVDDVVRPELQQMVDALALPTLLVNARTDILAANPAARAVYEQVLGDGGNANYARLVFLDPAAPSFYQDWDDQADELVAVLRSATGRDPADRVLSDLVGQLGLRSTAFRSRWAAQTVRQRSFGVKRLRHHRVGDLDLAYETFGVPSEPRLSLLVYRAEPGSLSEQALAHLTAPSTITGGGSGGDG